MKMDTSANKQLVCTRCGKEQRADKNFYRSNSTIYGFTGYIPICKNCVNELYDYYWNKYGNEDLQGQKKVQAQKKVVRRICMLLNVYYEERIVETALSNVKTTLMAAYFRFVSLSQYKKDTFDKTLDNENINETMSLGLVGDDVENYEVPEEVKKRFGQGFTNADYIYLQEQYEDWTTRHECQTKAQEEIFKRICFKQLEIHKATLKGEDTKDLDATFQKLLETAKLQPRQNAADTISQAQTFGTLIDKFENTRPLPEIDDELKDVDHIGMYLEVFFKGHLAKVMGLRNGVSKHYEEQIKKYTVTKPELNEEEDTEALFDALFGNSSDEDND